MAQRGWNGIVPIVIVALAVALAFALRPLAPFDALPELPRLVENPPAAHVADFPAWTATPRDAVQLAAALFALAALCAWSAVVERRAWHGVLAFAFVSLHPSTWVAATTARGGHELAALALAAVGAAILVRDRPAFRELGAGMLVVACWWSPSGIGVATFALALAARASGPVRPVVLLAVLPRVFGAPGLLDWFGVRFAGTPDGASAVGLFGAMRDAFATLAGASGSAWIGEAGHAAFAGIAVGAIVLLALATRGPARIAVGVAALGTAVVGFSASSGALVPSSGLVPIVLTLAYAASAPRTPRASSLAAGVALLALVATATTTTLRVVRPSTSSLDALTAMTGRLGRERPIAHRAALIELERGGNRVLHDVLVRDDAALRALDPESARDVALLAAQFGLADEALPLLERAMFGAKPRGPLRPSELELDLLDLKLRAGRPRVVIRDVDEMLATEPAPRLRADLLVRRATAHALLALSTKFESDESARADHARQMFAAYADALAVAPEHTRALLDRGRAYLATGQAVEAVKDFEKVAKLRPDLAAPRLELAKLYFSRGQGEAGEAEIVAARRAQGDADPDVILVVTQLLVARGNISDAVHNAKQLEELQHRLRGGAEELGALYTQLGRAAEDAHDEALALELTRKARALGADATGENAARLARLLRQQRDFAGELAVLLDAQKRELPITDLRAQIVAAHKNVGYAALFSGDKAAACASFLDAAQSAANADELGAVSELIRNLAGELKGDAQERVLTLAKVAYSNAQDAERARNWIAAEGAYRVSLSLLPQNPFAWFQLGESLAAQQRKAEAIDAWTRAVALGTELDMQEVVTRANERLAAAK